MLGIPAIAVSQLSAAATWTTGSAARSTSRTPRRSSRGGRPARRRPAARGHAAQLNVPPGEIGGVEVTRLGKRVYQDAWTSIEEDRGRKLYRIYGDVPLHDDEPGHRPAAVAEGRSPSRRCTSTSPPSTGWRRSREYDLAQLLEADDVDPTS